MRRCHCPECGGLVRVPGSVQPEDFLRCPQCSSLLEVVSLDPLELEPVEDLFGRPRVLATSEEAEWDWTPEPGEENFLSEADWDILTDEQDG